MSVKELKNRIEKADKPHKFANILTMIDLALMSGKIDSKEHDEVKDLAQSKLYKMLGYSNEQ